MLDAIVLLPDEIERITNKRRYTAQIRVLREMRIPFKLRIDGSPCVFREAANQHMGVAESIDKKTDIKLNLEAL